MLPFSIFTGLQLFSVRAVADRELFSGRELCMPSLVSFSLLTVCLPFNPDSVACAIMRVPDAASRIGFFLLCVESGSCYLILMCPSSDNIKDKLYSSSLSPFSHQSRFCKFFSYPTSVN